MAENVSVKVHITSHGGVIQSEVALGLNHVKDGLYTVVTQVQPTQPTSIALMA